MLPAYDALFENRKGWTGADGAYSLVLSEEKILWMFGDTWQGEIRNGAHVNATIVNNSIAIQSGLSPPNASVDFYFGRTADRMSGAFILPADGKGWFWPYHGVLTRQGLYFFLVQIERTENPTAGGFKVIGTWLAHVANPLDPPESWRITQHRIPWGNFTTPEATFYGSWVLRRAPWLYIYGTTEDVIDGFHHKYMILARVPEDDLAQFDQWRFYAKGTWSTDFSRAERLCEGLANEYSVSFLQVMQKFVVIYSESSSSRNIAARFASDPWGPWSDPVVLCQCPEVARGEDILCYAAKGHPELSSAPDEVIITYVANSSDFYKMAADASLYRPRFLRARFKGFENN